MTRRGVLQELAVDANENACFENNDSRTILFPDAKIDHECTLEALRRLSFLVPLRDILPEALPFFSWMIGFITSHKNHHKFSERIRNSVYMIIHSD
jgi:hypothetical protein